jgi:hypothetical protein
LSRLLLKILRKNLYIFICEFWDSANTAITVARFDAAAKTGFAPPCGTAPHRVGNGLARSASEKPVGT